MTQTLYAHMNKRNKKEKENGVRWKSNKLFVVAWWWG
jgi:hypothetical protein